MQVYRVDDLSNGLEAEKLNVLVLNKYNYQQITPFEYITELDLSKDLKEFDPIEGCACSSNNCEDSDACVCDGVLKFCTASCQCTACPKHFRAIFNRYQVYYVNPKKEWGLRTLQFIKKGSFLFEYTGILTYDHEDVDEGQDDYIYQYNYKGKDYMINAHEKGNLARFINHSCSPNCDTNLCIIDEQGAPHLIIVAKCNITEGEEVTLDYGDPWWKAKGKTCICEATACRYLEKGATTEIVVHNGPYSSTSTIATTKHEPKRLQIAAKKAYQPPHSILQAKKCSTMQNTLHDKDGQTTTECNDYDEIQIIDNDSSDNEDKIEVELTGDSQPNENSVPNEHEELLEKD